MGRRKNQEPEIALGIVDEFEIEDEAIIEEPVPAEECLNITEAKITRVAGDEIWISVNDLGFIITTTKIEPWMVKGAKIYVMHEGTPGKADFKIAGVQE